jgi:ABC-type Fe3+ transport system, permease component
MATFAKGRREIRLLARDPLLALLVVLLFLSLALFVAYPLLSVLVKSLQTDEGTFTFGNYTRFLSFKYLRSSLWNSLTTGFATAAASVAVGYAAAFTITRTSIRWKKALHLLFILPIISPPFTSALSILMLFGANGLITRGLLGIRNYNIYGFKGVLISQIFTFAPVAYLTLKGVLESLNPPWRTRP